MDEARVAAAIKYFTKEACQSTNPIAVLMTLLVELDEQHWSNQEMHRIKTACWRILAAAYGATDEPQNSQD